MLASVARRGDRPAGLEDPRALALRPCCAQEIAREGRYAARQG